jgi:alkylated DNA repair dioxygenase AlkB
MLPSQTAIALGGGLRLPILPKFGPVKNQVGITSLAPNSFVEFYPNFLDKNSADALFKDLLDNIPWRNSTYKGIPLPRLQCWMSDPDVNPQELFQKEPALKWSEKMMDVKERLDPFCAEHAKKFDYVVMQLYRNGQDMSGWHFDGDAKEPGRNIIASVSLGATRKFLVKEKPQNFQYNMDALFDDIDTSCDYEFDLAHGSLAIMRGDMQNTHLHAVPRLHELTEPRINLTFRISK